MRLAGDLWWLLSISVLKRDCSDFCSLQSSTALSTPPLSQAPFLVGLSDLLPFVEREANPVQVQLWSEIKSRHGRLARYVAGSLSSLCRLGYLRCYELFIAFASNEECCADNKENNEHYGHNQKINAW